MPKVRPATQGSFAPASEPQDAQFCDGEVVHLLRVERGRVASLTASQFE